MKDLGLKQGDLADMLGVSQAAISKWITGKTISPLRIQEIARALDCQTDWLADGSGPPPPAPFADVTEPSAPPYDTIPRFSRRASPRVPDNILAQLLELLEETGAAGDIIRIIVAARAGRLSKEDMATLRHVADRLTPQRQP